MGKNERVIISLLAIPGAIVPEKEVESFKGIPACSFEKTLQILLTNFALSNLISSEKVEYRKENDKDLNALAEIYHYWLNEIAIKGRYKASRTARIAKNNAEVLKQFLQKAYERGEIREGEFSWRDGLEDISEMSEEDFDEAMKMLIRWSKEFTRKYKHQPYVYQEKGDPKIRLFGKRIKVFVPFDGITVKSNGCLAERIYRSYKSYLRHSKEISDTPRLFLSPTGVIFWTLSLKRRNEDPVRTLQKFYSLVEDDFPVVTMKAPKRLPSTPWISFETSSFYVHGIKRNEVLKKLSEAIEICKKANDFFDRKGMPEAVEANGTITKEEAEKIIEGIEMLKEALKVVGGKEEDVGYYCGISYHYLSFFSGPDAIRIDFPQPYNVSYYSVLNHPLTVLEKELQLFLRTGKDEMMVGELADLGDEKFWEEELKDEERI